MGFVNFYWQFIQGFNKIAKPLTFLLTTANLSENLLISIDIAEKNEVVGGGGFNRTNKNLFKSQKPKNSTILSNIGAKTKNIGFLTSKASTAFIQLKQAFTKALIVWHFDLECHIRIETDISDYAICRVLNQLILNSGQWHLMPFFSRKMILAKTRYKTYNGELLAIVEAFKTWRHYLKGCKYKVFVLINYNNLCQFMDIKSLSFCQV